MHVVQCPHCQRKFKVPALVVDARMKCSRCGRVFVGTSAEASEAPRPAVPPTAGGQVPEPALEPTQTQRKTSNTAVIMLVCCILAVLAIIGMGIGIYYLQTHPTVEERDAKTGRLLERRRTTMTEAERKAADIRAAAAEERRRRQGLPPAVGPHTRPGPTAGTTPQTEAMKSDPKLQTIWAVVHGGTIGNVVYVCGTVTNKYTTPRRQITVIAYVDGAQGPSRTYQFVPAGEIIRYSIRLGSRQIDKDSVKVVARGSEPADENMIVWAIDSDQMELAIEKEKVIWSGRTRNPSSVPVKNVRIYCDFFANDGIQAPGDSPIGKLEDGHTIGAGKSASFRVAFDTPGAQGYRIRVARAVGWKY